MIAAGGVALVTSRRVVTPARAFPATRLPTSAARVSRAGRSSGSTDRRRACRYIRRGANDDRYEGRTLSVVFIDLDQFKSINDRHGHDLGDRVLQAVADRLQSTVRADDRVGRLGGDEFLVVCPGLDERSAGRTAHRIRRQLNFGLRLDAVEIPVRASLGLSFYRPDDATTAAVMIAAADADMYRDKRRLQLQRSRRAEGLAAS